MTRVFSFDYFGSTLNAESIGVDIMPSTQEILSSHCIPFTTDRKIVAVNVIGRGVDIPGGHIDEGETPISAMQREALEEAQIIVSNPVLIDIWRLSSINDKLGLLQKPYLILYVVDIELMNSFLPTEEVAERFILEPEDFIAQYFGDREQAQIMVSRALAIREDF